jgi:hypothetical protein
MKLWTHPDCYMGETWPGHYVSLGQRRNSDALTRSNFRCALAALKAIPEPPDWPHDDAPVQVVRESHWAVGWVEWIAIHQDFDAHVAEGNRIESRLEDYPVLDEDDFSALEQEDAEQVWKTCYSPKERIEYIRKRRAHCEFHHWRDLLSCVRGEWFAGYASDLIG